tara:strand:+ start:2257 stop:2889 length:633 start_codon:yes stop_codon:yes gene_type:complete
MKLQLSFILILFTNLALYAGEVVLENPEVNQLAPDFVGVDSNGQSISLSSFVGKPVVLEWTNHECPYVARHYAEQNMQKIQQLVKNEGYVWLSIISSSPGEQGYVSPAKANQLSDARQAIPDHVIMDESGAIGMLYGAKTTPHMFMIDANGILRFKGGIDDIGGGMKFFTADIESAKNYVAINNQPVKDNKSAIITESVPYGCSVKYNYD